MARDQFEHSSPVTATVSADEPHRVDLVAHDFNELAEQHYTAYLFTGSGKAMAGVTSWKGTPFSFFAVKTANLVLPSFRPGGVQPADLAGSYSFFLDGAPGTITLEHTAGDRLEGTCRPRHHPEELAVTAEVGRDVPHGVTLRLHRDGGGGDRTEVNGYLFTRPKNAVAGLVADPAGPLAFYMFRYR